MISYDDQSHIEAEHAVLGAILSSAGAVLDEIALTEDDFYDPREGDLFALMKKMRDEGTAITLATVQDRADPRSSHLVARLCVDFGYVEYAVNEHASMVARRGLQRRLGRVGATLSDLSEHETVESMIEYARFAVDAAISTSRSVVEFVPDIVGRAVESIEGGTSFIPTPWAQLNNIIGGCRPGTLLVVAARPGVGKTVIAQGLATALAANGNVAFSSLEMSKSELVQRFIADRADVSIGRMKSNKMRAEDWERFADARGSLDLSIAIDDRGGIGPAEVRNFARSVARLGPLSGIVVDYMQLMTAKTKGQEKRHEQVADFSRQLKLIAKDFNVPVIALAQLNRESEGQMGRARPKMSQLRESGAIEQDADVVLLLHREADESGNLSGTEITFDVAKNRHGGTGHVTLQWDGSRSRVTDFPFPTRRAA